MNMNNLLKTLDHVTSPRKDKETLYLLENKFRFNPSAGEKVVNFILKISLRSRGS